MKKIFLVLFTGILAILLIHCAATRKTENLKADLGSFMKSHNAGKDCMKCHNSDKIKKLAFTLAGTIYDKEKNGLKGAVIALYTKAEGTEKPVFDLTSDGKGSFYTMAPLDFKSGIFLRITSGTKTVVKNMPVHTGSCNSCHGKSEPGIVID
jgi:hypothetical protein